MYLLQVSFQLLFSLESLRAESTCWFIRRYALAIGLVLNQSVHPHKPLATFEADVARGRFCFDLPFSMTNQMAIQMNSSLVSLATNWTVQVITIALFYRFRMFLQTLQIRILLLL